MSPANMKLVILVYVRFLPNKFKSLLAQMGGLKVPKTTNFKHPYQLERQIFHLLIDATLTKLYF